MSDKEDLISVMFDLMPQEDHPLLVMIRHDPIAVSCQCEHCKHYREVLERPETVERSQT